MNLQGAKIGLVGRQVVQSFQKKVGRWLSRKPLLECVALWKKRRQYTYNVCDQSIPNLEVARFKTQEKPGQVLGFISTSRE